MTIQKFLRRLENKRYFRYYVNDKMIEDVDILLECDVEIEMFEIDDRIIRFNVDERDFEHFSRDIARYV